MTWINAEQMCMTQREFVSSPRLVLLGVLAGVWVVAMAPTAAAQVSGVVVDDGSGLPIAGARVTLRATDQVVTAAADGSFTIDVPAGDATLVGAARGYFNRGELVAAPASGVELRLESVHADDPAGSIADPAACGACHDRQFSEWYGSAMGQAGRNVWVLDLFDGTGTPGGSGGFVYARDSTSAAASPTSECAACHQPTRWLAEGPVALGPVDPPSAPVGHGVQCGVCHQMADIDETRPNTPGVLDGYVQMTRSADPDQVVMYGALGDVDYTVTGRMRASYNPIVTSAMCAACHQDANDPDHDGDYEEEGSIISEPTYLEWLDSPYADPASPQYATCVDCHMPATDATLACNVGTGYEREEGQLRSHRIEGTTAQFLENAVELSVEATRSSGSVDVDVRVHNGSTGHHVPTGVTTRNVILRVEVRAGERVLGLLDGPMISELGGVGDPELGYFAGLPGNVFAHRSRDAEGNGPVFFTEAAGVVEDTRIAPLATDVTHYEFEAAGADETVTVRAWLVYRRAWRVLVDAKGWTQDGHGRPLEDIAPPHFGHLMEETSVTLTAEGADAGAPDGGTTPPPSGDCDCRAARAAGSSHVGWVLGALAVGLWRRRR